VKNKKIKKISALLASAGVYNWKTDLATMFSPVEQLRAEQ